MLCCHYGVSMNKRQIVAKLQSDKAYADKLMNILDDTALKMKLEVMSNYISGLLEHIQQDGKV